MNSQTKNMRFILGLLIVFGLNACGGSGGDTPADDLAYSSTVASARVIAPGTECANGGIEVDTGIDTNQNGVLDTDEIVNTETICNGVDGTDGSDGLNGIDGVAGTNGVDGLDGQDGADGLPGLPGADGADGINGTDGTDGVDGINGTDGIDGADGSDGLISLIAMGDEPAGINCDFGGTRIDTGIDNNGNGILEETEVTDTEFICALSSTEFDGLVYTADANSVGMSELFRTAKDSSSVSKLTGPKIISGRVYSFKVSPDRTKVLVLGDLDTNGIDELYVVSLLDGSPALKVSAELVTGGEVDYSHFEWSPDGRRVAYIADQDNDTVNELYTVFADGTGKAKVSAPLVTGGDVHYFQWSPDSSRIVYRADQVINGEDELFTVFANGTENIKVSGTLVAGGDVFYAEDHWSPDGSRILYVADQEFDGVLELYTVTPEGTARVKVSGPLVAGGTVDNLGTQWSPDGSRIVYSAEQDADNVVELYTVFADGTGNTKVSGTLVPGGDVNYIGFRWSPDGSRIAYSADQDTLFIEELYTVNADGSLMAKVSGVISPGGVGVKPDHQWSPDSSRIAYRADQDTNAVIELYNALADGTGNVKVSGNMVENGEVSFDFRWSPDSSRLAYIADQEINNTYELYSVLADGNGLVKISGNMVTNGDVSFLFKWSPDGNLIAYSADKEINDVTELYTVFPDGTNTTKVSGTMEPGGNVKGFSW